MIVAQAVTGQIEVKSVVPGKEIEVKSPVPGTQLEVRVDGEGKFVVRTVGAGGGGEVVCVCARVHV